MRKHTIDLVCLRYIDSELARHSDKDRAVRQINQSVGHVEGLTPQEDDTSGLLESISVSDEAGDEESFVKCPSALVGEAAPSRLPGMIPSTYCFMACQVFDNTRYMNQFVEREL